MRWVRDNTGRFTQRPHFEPRELDVDSENIVGEFLGRKYSKVHFPVLTDDLCLLVEECTDDLDYVDLPDGIFGVTEFMTGRRPSVRISKALSDNPRMENPLRTTLTHELGHVRFHGPIWELEEQSPRLFDVKKPGGHRHESHRDRILGGSENIDWMEWQAGYISGALLMPFSVLKEHVSEFRKERGITASLMPGTPHTDELIDVVSSNFRVSRDAARVRLSQLSCIVNDPRAYSIAWS